MECICCNACQISSALNTAKSSSFIAEVTREEIAFKLASKLEGLSDLKIATKYSRIVLSIPS